MINIGIIEDHELVREGFVSMLNGYPGMSVTLEANNGKELIKALKESLPDIILLDIEMPVMDGIEAMEKIRRLYPKIKIIVISAHSEDLEVLEYVRLGANSFLPKHSKKSTLIAAILEVQEKGTYFEKRHSDLISKYFPQPKAKKEKKLSERDLKFLSLFLAGKSYEEIAEEMNVVEKTLIWYKHHIMTKTNSKSIIELKSHLAEIGVVFK